MRRVAVVLLALWPAVAGAELRARTRDLGAASPVADYAQWTAATTMTGSTCDVRASDLLTWKGAAVTFARSDGTLCCPESDASCCWAAANQPCVHGPSYSGWAGSGGGIEVYGAGANALTHSEAIDAWTASGATISVSATDQLALPGGSATMDKVTSTGTSLNHMYKSTPVASSAGPFTHSAWFSAETGTAVGSIGSVCGAGTVAACTCGRSDGVAPTAVITSNVDCRCHSTFATTNLRMWATATCSTAAAAQYPVIAAAHLAAGSILVGGAQFTPTAYPVPYRPTTGTAYAGAASTATTLTVPVALTDPTRWAISVTATGPLATRGIWSWGTIGAANSVGLYETTNWLAFAVWDASAASRTTIYSLPADLSSTRVMASAGLALSVNGAAVGSTSGAGAGVLSSLPTGALKIGDNQATGVYFGGLYQRVVQCRKAGGCK